MTDVHNPQVTSATLRDLAAQAVALGAAIDAAYDQLGAAEDASTRRCGGRLIDSGGDARAVAEGLTATADDLARLVPYRRHVSGRVGRLPGSWKHPDGLRRTVAVPGARVWSDVGLRP